MELVNVILERTGKEIQVLPAEIPGLQAAGLIKEEKAATETKEEKKTGSTKLDAGTISEAEAAQAAMDQMKPKSSRPVNISHKNIKQGG